MKPLKTLYVKTYGKQMRKITAWISPEEHRFRRAFDSTPSSDETSVFEAAKLRPRKDTRARKDERPAKRKALLCLSKLSSDDMSNEENVSPRSNNARKKRTTVDSEKEMRPARRKATLCVNDKSRDEENLSDEENIFRPDPVPAGRGMKTRKSRLASAPVFTRQRGQGISFSSESELEVSAPKHRKVSAKQKTNSKVHCPSAGRFVTRRRRIASTKPPIRKISILNSSEDFTAGEFYPRKTFRPPRRKRAPPAFGGSSTESSVNIAGTCSFITVPFREISLNESGDHSLGPSSRKPIFCSTPSAASSSRWGHSKPNQVPTPPSVSVSCIGASNTFQCDLVPARQPLASPQSASMSALSDYNKVQSPDLFLEPKRGSCSKGAKDLSEDSEAKRNGELPSVVLLSEDSGSSSRFISAAGGLEWLVEALKQKCLSQSCTVQLERLAYLPVTRLYSQTTYSSCVEESSSVDSQQIKAPPQSLAESLHHHNFKTNNERRDYLHGINSFNRSASASDSTNGLPSDVCKESGELSNRKSRTELSDSVIEIDSTQHTDHSFEIIMDPQVLSSTSVLTRFTEEEIKAAMDECVSKKCTVQLKKRLSLKSFTQQKEVGATHERFIKQKANQSGEEGSVSFRKPKRGLAATGRCTGSEEEAKLILKEKCPTAKKKFQPKGAPSKSHGSESARNDRPVINLVTESDCDGNAASSKASRRYGSSLSSETASGKEAENAGETIPTREKMPLSLENKRRSVITQQTGTARKACVSGMSVSRWKNKGDAGTHAFRREKVGSSKMVDCSISELISKQCSQPKEVGATLNFSTPLRVSQLNLLSLLSDLSPNTHTWSRLKSALSVHRKVQLTPRSVNLSSPVRSSSADISHDLFATPSRLAFSRHLSSQLLSQHSLHLNEDEDLSDAEKVYAECGQQHPLPWGECILPHRMKACEKIGEGTFGEVFSTTNASGETMALKIIPVEGREKVNGEDQKTFGEILHEIIISKELSSLKEKQQNQTHGFIGLNDLHCVQGCYPADFLKAWDAYDRRKVSENDRPDFFENNQLFIILEFEFGGADLENSNGKLASLVVAKSILHQVTAALAVAEQELHFEHRDLHWGNVLVKTTKEKTANFLLNERPHSVTVNGVLVRIIDYSLSRLEIDDLTVSCDISNDEELFMGQGDYQFEIYRLMRQENGNNWSDYHPHSNVLWLHYLCSKLLSMKYRSSRGKAAKDIHKELVGFYNNVLQYRSATEALQNCSMFQHH